MRRGSGGDGKMIPVLTAEGSRRCDKTLMERYGHDGYGLMCRAGEGIVRTVVERFPNGCRTLICCGPGNNGGDGFVVARLLKERSADALTAVLCDPARLTGDALTAYREACEAGCPMTDGFPGTDGFDCAIDALFGTGLSRELSEDYRSVIEALNRSGIYKIAVDIPSGIDGTRGTVCGAALRADETVTMQYLKYGLVLTPGRIHAGHIRVCEIAPEYPAEGTACLLEEEDIRAMLPERPLDSHKGKNGHALLVGGSSRYTGAVLMSARAALRGGAGITSAAVPAAVRPVLFTLPEVISVPCGDGGSWDVSAADAFEKLDLSRYSAFAVGPGLDEMTDPRPVERLLETGKPLVIDADALNLLSRERRLLAHLHANILLTPHPGEMARLTGKSVAELLEDPVGTAIAAARDLHCTVLLKGATSVITDGKDIRFNTSGNAGLAKGGSGDVLTGIALAMLSQGLNAFDAGCAASFLLGVSADRAMRVLSNRALIASDVIDML